MTAPSLASRGDNFLPVLTSQRSSLSATRDVTWLPSGENTRCRGRTEHSPKSRATLPDSISTRIRWGAWCRGNVEAIARHLESVAITMTGSCSTFEFFSFVQGRCGNNLTAPSRPRRHQRISLPLAE